MWLEEGHVGAYDLDSMVFGRFSLCKELIAFSKVGRVSILVHRTNRHTNLKTYAIKGQYTYRHLCHLFRPEEITRLAHSAFPANKRPEIPATARPSP